MQRYLFLILLLFTSVGCAEQQPAEKVWPYAPEVLVKKCDGIDSTHDDYQMCVDNHFNYHEIEVQIDISEHQSALLRVKQVKYFSLLWSSEIIDAVMYCSDCDSQDMNLSEQLIKDMSSYAVDAELLHLGSLTRELNWQMSNGGLPMSTNASRVVLNLNSPLTQANKENSRKANGKYIMVVDKIGNPTSSGFLVKDRLEANIILQPTAKDDIYSWTGEMSLDDWNEQIAQGPWKVYLDSKVCNLNLAGINKKFIAQLVCNLNS